MYQVLSVTVFCNDHFITKGDDEIESLEMKIDGKLFFNPETRSQSQGYKCPVCEKEITVLIEQPL